MNDAGALRLRIADGTLYPLLPVEVPTCFVRLDDAFARRFASVPEALANRAVQLASNLARRMGDAEWYADQIARAGEGPSSVAANLTGTLLVGFFGACKSALDAAAIAAAESLALVHAARPLANRDQDFGKGRIWRALEAASGDAAARYGAFRPLANEIIQWRDVAVHRVSPITIAVAPASPGRRVHVFLAAGMEAAEIFGPRGFTVERAAPGYFYARWKPGLLRLCDEACRDLEAWAG